MNRADKRRQQRRGKQYDGRQTFTKDEVEKMNNAAYEYGLFFGLRAAARTAGVGGKRLIEMKQEILKIEEENGVSRSESPKWLHTSIKDLREGTRLQ